MTMDALAHSGPPMQRAAMVEDAASVVSLPALTVGEDDLNDCVQIACGTFSPLTGFMDSDALCSVISGNRLPDGTVWTMPVVLLLSPDEAAAAVPGTTVALADVHGRRHALLDVSEVAPVDVDWLVRGWFGTDSDQHPGVRRVKALGPMLVGGAVRLLSSTLPNSAAPTPADCRRAFAERGWLRVVGFHSRNVPHRVHEHIQFAAMEHCGADGLLISPVVGTRKPGDFLAEPILRAYRHLIDAGVYPAGRAMLAPFSTYPRYAGPREAVFTALCRKNMGCSHFIVGRDHTGVGDFYDKDAVRRLFESLPDLGIAPVFFEAIAYDPRSGRYVPETQAEHAEQISGTQVRQAILAGRRLPDWLIRDSVQNLLAAMQADGQPLFQT